MNIKNYMAMGEARLEPYDSTLLKAEAKALDYEQCWVVRDK